MPIVNVIKTLADENRLRILNIVRYRPLCVGEIQTLLGITQSNASRHLERLKQSGLVSSSKDAQRVYYHADDALLASFPFVRTLFDQLDRERTFTDDISRFNKYKESGLTCQDLKAVDFDYSRLNLG